MVYILQALLQSHCRELDLYGQFANPEVNKFDHK